MRHRLPEVSKIAAIRAVEGTRRLGTPRMPASSWRPVSRRFAEDNETVIGRALLAAAGLNHQRSCRSIAVTPTRTTAVLVVIGAFGLTGLI